MTKITPGGREPTLLELDQLLEHQLDSQWADGSDYDTWVDWIARARIVVIEGYVSDTPGYTGNVMVVIWPGGPELVSIYGWDRRTKTIHEIADTHDNFTRKT